VAEPPPWPMEVVEGPKKKKLKKGVLALGGGRTTPKGHRGGLFLFIFFQFFFCF